MPQHLTVLMRNLLCGQETTVRIEYGETRWYPIDSVRQGYILSSYLFNLYTELTI